MQQKPAIWFPTVRTGTGTDVFTERLVQGLFWIVMTVHSPIGNGNCKLTHLPLKSAI